MFSSSLNFEKKRLTINALLATSLIMMLSFLVVSAFGFIGNRANFLLDYAAAIAAPTKEFTIGQQGKQEISVPINVKITIELQGKAKLTAKKLSMVFIDCNDQAKVDLHGPIVAFVNAGVQLRINAYMKDNIAPIIIINTIDNQPTIKYINDGGNSEITSAGYSFKVIPSQYHIETSGLTMTQNGAATEGVACGYEGVTEFDLGNEATFYDFKYPLSETVIIVIVVVVLIVVIVACLFILACCCPMCCPCLACLIVCCRKKGNDATTPSIVINNNNNNSNNTAISV